MNGKSKNDLEIWLGIAAIVLSCALSFVSFWPLKEEILKGEVDFTFIVQNLLPFALLCFVCFKFLPKILVAFKSPKRPRINTNVLNFKIPKSLNVLEIKRRILVKKITDFKIKFIPLALIIGLFIAHYISLIYGVACAGLLYLGLWAILLGEKKRAFVNEFKHEVITRVAAHFGLRYDPAGSLGLAEFFMIYDCSVDEYYGEDLISGEIEGVNVKFSDFCALMEVKTKNHTTKVPQFQGVLFVADFNKKLAHTTRVHHVKSKNLAHEGRRANMDNVKFERLFDVYCTDQIAARYVLTPAMMERILGLEARFNAPIDLVFTQNKIFIAVETWTDGFEPNIDLSLIKSQTLSLYMSQIQDFVDIVKELKLNQKIWI